MHTGYVYIHCCIYFHQFQMCFRVCTLPRSTSSPEEPMFWLVPSTVDVFSLDLGTATELLQWRPQSSARRSSFHSCFCFAWSQHGSSSECLRVLGIAVRKCSQLCQENQETLCACSQRCIQGRLISGPASLASVATDVSQRHRDGRFAPR